VITALPSREVLADFAPFAERAVSIDEAATIRLRGGSDLIAGFVRLPYEVLAGRTLAAAGVLAFDATFLATELLAWLDADGPTPQRRDAFWLSALPPAAGWTRIEVVPDSAIRNVVRSGAMLAQGMATRAGQESLLGSTVLHASSDTGAVEVPLGPLTALTRMGFLPQGSQAAIDTAPGWVRVAAQFGSTFITTGAGPLGTLNLM